MSVGWGNLGDRARWQMERMRADPRTAGDVALVEALRLGIEEAEQMRSLGLLGLEQLRGVLSREEKRLGVSHDDPELTSEQRHALQPYWERSESARLELEAETPHLNAMALVSLYSALDSFVESLVPLWVETMTTRLRERLVEKARARFPELRSEAVEQLMLDVFDTEFGRLTQQQMRKRSGLAPGGGQARYELALETVGLATPDDRPFPESLDEALTEVAALRNVIVHRGGRVDARARKAAPTLQYAEGEFVRIDRAHYARYSAALRVFAQEILDRLFIRMGGTAENRLGDWERFTHTLF